MAIASGQITVGTTPVQVDGNYVSWSHIHVKNLDETKNLYLGSQDVTALNGYPVSKAESFEHDLPPGKSLWLVSGSGTINVAWFRIDR